MHQMVKTPAETSRRWWVLAIVVSAQFMFGVDAFIVNVAIPTIAAELHASPAEIEAVIAIYLIAYATLVVTGGRLGDIFGTKSIFIAGVAGFALTSLWCGLAQSGPELILARLAQGATAALMVPQVLATLHLLFADSARARAFAIYGVVLGLAGAAGFALGGLLVTIDLAGLGWRSVFFVNVPLGAAALWLTVHKVSESRDEEAKRIDLRGQITLGLGLGTLVFGLLRGDVAGWTDVLVLCAAGAGVLLLAAFVVVELHVPYAMLPLRLLKSRDVAGAQLSVFAISASVFASFLYVTLYLQGPLGLSPIQTGLMYLPGSVAMFLVSWMTPHLGRRLGQGTLATAGLAIGTVGLALLFLDGTRTNWLPVLLQITLIFLGVGLYNPAISMVALAAVPVQQSGLAAGTLDTSRHSGTALGTAALGALVPTTSALGNGSGAAYVTALHHVIVLAVALAVVGAIASAMLIGRHRAPVPVDDEVILSTVVAEEALAA